MYAFKSAIAALLTAASLAPTAQASEFPSKPIRVLVASQAGSAPDIIARLVGDSMSRALGQPIIVDNRPGAGGVIVMNTLRNAPADGYTLALIHAAIATVTPLTYKAASFDIERDFQTVGTVGITPMLFTANKNFPAKTLPEAIAQAKAKPDAVAAGSPSRTSIPHLANELLASKAEVKFQQVPFGSSPQGVQAMLAGDIPMYTDGVAPLIGLVKGGKINALAVSSDTVLPGLEGIPLAKDTIPGLVVYGWFTMHAPKGTPKAVLERLNTELNKSLARPDVVAKLADFGTFPKASTLDEAAAFTRREKELFGGVVKSMGLQPE